MSPRDLPVAEQPTRGPRADPKLPTPRPPAAEPPKQSRLRRPVVLMVLGVVVLALIVGGVLWWLHARHYESTDDAFIDVHMTRVAPQVAGRVLRVAVNDNQEVTRGELLVEIDPADYQARLDQATANQATAEANLAQAKAQQVVAQADAEQAKAQVGVAEANATNAAIQLKRDQPLAEHQVVSRQTLDNDVASQRSTAANLVAAQKRQASTEAQLAVSAAQVNAAEASLKSAAAQVAQAQLNLGYTKLTAAEGGRVARKNVAVGDYVQVGQNLMAMVPDRVWISANFKETQLDLMRVGQAVDIRVDACPGKTFRGHVDSFQPGSGAVFSLLPPENATGNYVKVVQRVPVKIVFDDPPDPSCPLGPGMSVVPTVKVR
ncbi:MAG TPA: HlyD family secretion protein [Stellaceae bacterium]